MIRISLSARSREIPGLRRASDIQVSNAAVAGKKIAWARACMESTARLAAREPKLRQGHADDGERTGIQRQLFTQDVGIAVQSGAATDQHSKWRRGSCPADLRRKRMTVPAPVSFPESRRRWAKQRLFLSARVSRHRSAPTDSSMDRSHRIQRLISGLKVPVIRRRDAAAAACLWMSLISHTKTKLFCIFVREGTKQDARW